MKHSKLSVAFIIVLLGGLASLYVSRDMDPAEHQPMEPITIPFQEEFEAPQTQYTVPDLDAFVAQGEPAQSMPEPEPLPSLADSDAAVKRAVTAILDMPDIANRFMLKDFITRFVVSVDNLPGKSIPDRFRLVKRVDGVFLVLRAGEDHITLDPANASRYDIYIKALQNINMQALLLSYVRLYPLFQEAYEELGYPDRYFNNRLVEVIGHLLDTPVITDPIELTQPKVFYQYAEERYEALSAGQKMLLRMGPQHSAIVRDFLQELHKQLTALSRVTAKSSGKVPAAHENSQ